jgi:hypothetical protein
VCARSPPRCAQALARRVVSLDPARKRAAYMRRSLPRTPSSTCPAHRSSVEPPSAPPSLSRHSAAPRSPSSRRTPRVHQCLRRRAGSRAASTSSSFVAKVRLSSPDYPCLPPMHRSTSSSALPPRRACCSRRSSCCPCTSFVRAARAISHVVTRAVLRVPLRACFFTCW